MRETLATKWRPDTFENTLGQESVISILKKQLELHEFKNCYLFSGPSGCGKTTLARIFANEINNHEGHPIEIDGASNNGVDNVRSIIMDASERSIDSEYKIFVIDECHAITNAGWQAFLKCIEEPPKYTIFMFCTTDPQKIPETIKNRVMRFNLSKVKTKDIEGRLKFVCVQEGYTNYDEACSYIAKISNGCVREALSYLDKCVGYSKDLSIENVIKSLGNFSYDSFFTLTNYLVNHDKGGVIKFVNALYDDGKDLRVFMDQYLSFIIDLAQYGYYKDLSCTKIPSYLKDKVDEITGNGCNEATSYFTQMTSLLQDIRIAYRYDTNMQLTTITMLLRMCGNGRTN